MGIIRFIRRILFCSRGVHVDWVPIGNEGGGIAGAGKCNDCGASWEAIKWPRE